MKRIFPLLLLLLICNSCNEGAASLSELSYKVFNGLKACKFEELSGSVPSLKGMDKYLELYEFNKFRDPAERKEEATRRFKEMNIALKGEYAKTTTSGKAFGIDWAKSTLKDYKYEVNDTKQGYHEAIIKLIISSDSKLFKVKCNSVQIAERWFLIQGMEVEK